MDIVALNTGTVRIKPSQVRAIGEGQARMMHVFGDPGWTDDLPMLAWAVMHPDGVIVVDAGETPRAMTPGWFPAGHPYYANAIKVHVREEDGIGEQLARLGVTPRDVRAVLLTHLHTDHVGGLHELPGAPVWAHATEWEQAQGEAGLQRGYLPHLFPAGFAPSAYSFDGPAVGPFARSHAVTAAGDVLVVETPGHTGGHCSVIVRDGATWVFLAGDATYAEETLLERAVDAISPDERVTLATIDRIRAFAAAKPVVYLPAHDVRSVERLRERRVTKPA